MTLMHVKRTSLDEHPNNERVFYKVLKQDIYFDIQDNSFVQCIMINVNIILNLINKKCMINNP